MSSKKPKLSEIRASLQWSALTEVEARENIAHLLELVKRLGNTLGRFSSEFPVPGCGYCTITIEPDGKVSHEATCPIPEARALLKELEL